jgi:hypothetical protein
LEMSGEPLSLGGGSVAAAGLRLRGVIGMGKPQREC